MRGVLIASASPAVRRSLAAVLGADFVVYEVTSVGEALSRAGIERMDVIFFDDTFADGDAELLASRLNGLEYGYEMVPLVLSDQDRYLQRFRPHGVRYAVTKPFNVQRIQEVLGQIEALTAALNVAPAPSVPAAPTPTASQNGSHQPGDYPASPPHDVVREISHRFRRLLSRSLNRDSLVDTFIEALQEQFDTDHVIVLLPARDAPCYRVVSGPNANQARVAYGLSMGEPLLAYVIRVGRPVSLIDPGGLDSQQRLKARRIAERLGIQYLCPVLSGGQAMALVGIGGMSDNEQSADHATLRLFLSFFSKALENAELHGRVSTAESTYHQVFARLPVGAVAVGPDGTVRDVNERAAQLLGLDVDDVLYQPVEKVGSLVADALRQVLVTGLEAPPRHFSTNGGQFSLHAVPLGPNAKDGASLAILDASAQAEPAPSEPTAPADDTELLAGLARVLAHNFKNAMVPIRTCAELLPERYHLEGFRASFFNVVEENTGKIDGWINRLLHFCDMPAGVGTRQTVPVAELIDDALQTAIPDPGKSPVTLAKDVDASLGVTGHAQALTQVFVEVINNALDSLQDCPEPTMRIHAKAGAADEAEILVEDNGVGIAEQEVEECFRPFRTNKLSGLGLGLAFAQRILRQHDGDIELSPGKDGGTRVSLHLPAVKLQAPVL